MTNYIKLPVCGKLRISATLSEAAKSMLQKPDIIVFDHEDNPVGIVTMMDILVGLSKNEDNKCITVADIMSTNFLIINELTLSTSDLVKDLKNKNQSVFYIIDGNDIIGYLHLR